MECKFIVGSKLDNIDPKELIDTLWNVNKTIKYYRQEGFYELIDTLWNVNCKVNDDLADSYCIAMCGYYLPKSKQKFKEEKF